MKILKILLLLTITQSCQAQDKKATIKEKKLILVDSFPIFTEKAFFQAANLQKLDKKQILAWDYQKLNFCLLDLSDKSIQFINNKGNQPNNFVGNDIYPLLSQDTLYVLETGNSTHLKCYDTRNKKFDLISNTPIYKYLGEFGVGYPPFQYVQAQNKILIPLTSKVNHFNESAYYSTENPVFGELVLKDIGKYTYKHILKFGDFPEMKEILKNNKKWWFAPDFVSSIYQEKLYLVPPFSKDIYVYDLKTEKISKIEVPISDFKTNFTIKFDEIAQGDESMEQQVKLFRANSHCVALQVTNEKIYYMYNQAFLVDELPKDLKKDFSKTVPNYILLVYDTKTKVIERINLGKKFRPNSLFVSDDNKVFLINSPVLYDDIFVYQIRWK
jgi:hypothetical protein